MALSVLPFRGQALPHGESTQRSQRRIDSQSAEHNSTMALITNQNLTRA